MPSEELPAHIRSGSPLYDAEAGLEGLALARRDRLVWRRRADCRRRRLRAPSGGCSRSPNVRCGGRTFARRLTGTDLVCPRRLSPITSPDWLTGSIPVGRASPVSERFFDRPRPEIAFLEAQAGNRALSGNGCAVRGGKNENPAPAEGNAGAGHIRPVGRPAWGCRAIRGEVARYGYLMPRWTGNGNNTNMWRRLTQSRHLPPQVRMHFRQAERRQPARPGKAAK